MEKMREKFEVSNAPIIHNRARLLKQPIESTEENQIILKQNMEKSHKRVFLESLIKIEKAKELEKNQAAGIVTQKVPLEQRVKQWKPAPREDEEGTVKQEEEKPPMTAEEIEMMNYKTRAEKAWNWYAGSSES